MFLRRLPAARLGLLLESLAELGHRPSDAWAKEAEAAVAAFAVGQSGMQ